MLLAQHDILISTPALIQLAEATVAVPVRLRFAVFLPDQLQGQVLVRLQLPTDLGKVRQGPCGLAGPPDCRPEQQLFQPVVIQIFRQRPAQPSRGSLL